MRIEKRLEKLEKGLKSTILWCAHIIIVEPGGSEKEAIEKIKAENEVHPDDDFTIIRLVEPDPN